MLFSRKNVDYTAMPLEHVTKQGPIKVCERCGKQGAYVVENIPQGKIKNGATP